MQVLPTGASQSQPAAQSGPARARPQPDWLAEIHALQPQLLRGLSADRLAGILSETRIQHYRRPREILRQGESAACGYLILRGRVEVSFLDTDGNRVLAHLANPGEVMGEVEQFSGRVCAATCTTLPDTSVMLFDAGLILRHMPADLLLRNFAGIFHDRLTRDNRQHSVAMFYAAEDRVRIHLLSMTSPATPEVRLSQTELAGFAGCSRQTVNKALSQLRAEGIVAMSRGMIRVLDRARLQVGCADPAGGFASAAAAPGGATAKATAPGGTEAVGPTLGGGASGGADSGRSAGGEASVSDTPAGEAGDGTAALGIGPTGPMPHEPGPGLPAPAPGLMPKA